MIARILLLFIGGIASLIYLCHWPQPKMSHLILQPPSSANWLGTDALGQDVLSRLLEALPNTLLIAFFCAILPLIIALLLASLSAIGGGVIDRILLKLTDVFLLIPALLPMMLLSALLQPGIWSVIVLISALSWPDDFKVLRAAVRRQLLSDALLNARSLGGGRYYLLSRYVWPALSPLLEALSLQNARQAIMLSAGLAFFGLTDPRLLNWGSLLLDAQQQIHGPAFWWLMPGPVVAITFLIVLVNSFNPKKNKGI